MIGLNNIYKEYKLVYLDTNVISNICKKGDLSNKFIIKYPIDKKYLICFSTYTLYEIAKNKTLYKDFKKFYSAYPCLLVISYFPLGVKEMDYIAGNTPLVNPILLSPQGITFEGKSLNPNSLELLLNKPEIKASFKNIHNYTTKYYNEVISVLDKPEFKHINKDNIKNKKGDFVRTFMRYEIKHRFLNGKNVEIDKKKLKKMKSLDVLAHAIFYKFFSDKQRKKEQSDIIDILIMTTTPYVDTFISENNAIDILKKIKKQTTAINNTNLQTLATLNN
ncbi:hypothetical protein [uncultured Tenacibaculum sp.]|uniref:hypothetical protein n=1 Tax=uncultured Tenacibaculum sp. TaxID=174713 RepID=UPI0026132A85|nr:hypothetical protein [uncultured Tenacibaculum sp.]